ncbi:MAG TPA: N-acetylglucosaminyltransferase, partial [Acholeplasma sp.]|nr:N-acetylglucosaminyltransferase [Acholeplasma sp.]
MKKLAYLIMVHKINEQLYQLIQQFPDDGVDIFIHLDEKCQDKLLILKPNVHLIDKRINVKWG